MGAPPTLRRAATVVATLGGIGRIPWAPGTWGSAVGLVVGCLAVRTISPPLAALALALTFLAGVSYCGRAEQALDRHDPPSVILDEAWGMAAVLVALPWTARSALWCLAAFALFRLFDIVKPPPLKWLATWPGGWGIMADDLGAAAYAVLLLWLGNRFVHP